MSQDARSLLGTLGAGLAIVVTLLGASWLSGAPAAPEKVDTWSYTTLAARAQAGDVRSLAIDGTSAIAVDREGGRHQVTLPDHTGAAASSLTADGVDVGYQGSSLPDGLLSILLGSIVPIVLVVVLGWFAISRLRGPSARLIASSPGRPPRADQPHVTFSHVAGAEEAKQELREVVDFLRSPLRFSAVGAHVPRGVLLVGPPGTGKTLMARAVAGQAAARFLSVSGSEFVEMYAGLGAARVRALFSQARSCAPCVVFIDEIDAVGRHRAGRSGTGSGEHDQTLNQLLVEMDGFETGSDVIVIAATNRPDILDPALLRPGRFDRHVRLDLPDRDGRREILAVHTMSKPLDDTVDLDVLARQTSGFSGADLANLANEAAILAARGGRRAIAMADVEEAFARLTAGPRTGSRTLSSTERATLAYHEAGHALVMLTLPGCDPVRSVSIVPRGQRLAWTLAVPAEDRSMLDRRTLADQVAATMAGRAAERLVFGDVSTAGEDDIARATRLARQMVTRWGMNERIGPVALAGAQGPRLARAGRLAALVDAEVTAVVRRAGERAGEVLERRRRHLDLIAERLLESESIDRPALDRLLAEEGRPPESHDQAPGSRTDSLPDTPAAAPRDAGRYSSVAAPAASRAASSICTSGTPSSLSRPRLAAPRSEVSGTP